MYERQLEDGSILTNIVILGKRTLPRATLQGILHGLQKTSTSFWITCRAGELPCVKVVACCLAVRTGEPASYGPPGYLSACDLFDLLVRGCHIPQGYLVRAVDAGLRPSSRPPAICPPVHRCRAAVHIAAHGAFKVLPLLFQAGELRYGYAGVRGRGLRRRTRTLTRRRRRQHAAIAWARAGPSRPIAILIGSIGVTIPYRDSAQRL